jgi:hypothetical protein
MAPTHVGGYGIILTAPAFDGLTFSTAFDDSFRQEPPFGEISFREASEYYDVKYAL